ncbi:catenin delta-2-like isoform X3 [Lineus longissimus]|uniref:catenin delta-2-like isoform X3 n=1 Tax=Lineus longissimus TaxID=88925 RepID=UPI00315D3AAB
MTEESDIPIEIMLDGGRDDAKGLMDKKGVQLNLKTTVKCGIDNGGCINDEEKSPGLGEKHKVKVIVENGKGDIQNGQSPVKNDGTLNLKLMGDISRMPVYNGEKLDFGKMDEKINNILKNAGIDSVTGEKFKPVGPGSRKGSKDEGSKLMKGSNEQCRKGEDVLSPADSDDINEETKLLTDSWDANLVGRILDQGDKIKGELEKLRERIQTVDIKGTILASSLNSRRTSTASHNSGDAMASSDSFITLKSDSGVEVEDMQKSTMDSNVLIDGWKVPETKVLKSSYQKECQSEWRVLHERGVMNMGDGSYGYGSYSFREDSVNNTPESPSMNTAARPPPGGEGYRSISSYRNTSSNGPGYTRQMSAGSESPHSSRLSVASNQSSDIRSRQTKTVTTVTKTTTSRQIYRTGSPGSYNQDYVNYPSAGDQAPSPAPPLDSDQRNYTPTRGYSDSPQPGGGHPSYSAGPPGNNYVNLPQADQYPDDGRFIRPLEDSYRDSPVDDRYSGPPPDGRLYSDGHYPDSYSPRETPNPRYPRADDSYSNPPEEERSNLQNNRYGGQQRLDDSYSNPPDSERGRTEPYYPPVDNTDGYPNGRPFRPSDSRDYDYYPQAQPNRPNRTPSPHGSDRYSGPPPYDSMQRRGYTDSPQPSLQGARPYDDIPREETRGLQAPPENFNPELLRRSPSIDSDTREPRWRNPDLPEVIEFLSHPSNNIKANAAAYLQHLTFQDDDMKSKTRALGGIPSLIELLNNDLPEVHKNASGALRNLSFGKNNDENKRAIKNADGIPALVRLLRKTPDNDIRELVTAILWNLSSCKELKKPIINDALTVLVNNVIIPHSGWDPNQGQSEPRGVYWSTVFRNASGVMRNVSSDGDYARKKLRECDGLVDALMFIVKAAIGKNDIDNKSVENCVCVLRNLCYGCQEVADPDYFKKRDAKKPGQKPGEPAGDNTGCFGGGAGKKNKKDPQKVDQRNRSDSGYQSGRTFNTSRTDPVRGMELLWQPSVVHIYLPLLSDCSNPETLEAAAGAIQNLAACEWEPSIEIRQAVRKEKGLPIIVELLSIEADRVVCAAATALRNLALDDRNKELIGKYAMQTLIKKLPNSRGQKMDYPVSDDTIAAVLATLYEIVKKNADFCSSVLTEGGIDSLIHITQSKGKYSAKVVKFAASVLMAMWQFKELQPEYKKKGYKEQHFVTKTMAARSHSGQPPVSANSTLIRPRQDQSGPVNEFNANTLPPIERHRTNDVSAMSQDADYGGQQPRFAGDPYGQNRSETYGNQMMDPYANRTDRDNYSDRVGDQYEAHFEDQLDRDYPPNENRQDDRYGSNPRENYERDDRYHDDINPYGVSTNAYTGRDESRLHNDSRDVEPYRQDSYRGEEIQMNEMNPYESRHDSYRPPAGGIAVLPQQGNARNDEPLYARVNKSMKTSNRDGPPHHMVLTDQHGGGGDGGADSWV